MIEDVSLKLSIIESDYLPGADEVCDEKKNKIG